jgi:uncharacterized protein YecT (DUF1311 family)
MYDKAMEQGKLQLASGELDKALASIELALDEKPKDKEAKEIYEDLVAYNEVKDAMENAKWDEALNKANNLLKKDPLSSIKTELEKDIKTAKENKKQNQGVEEELETDENVTVSNKEYYLQKLNNIESGLDDLKYLYDNGTTVDMREAASETYKRWDNALNEIYGVLKEELPDSEMSKLKVEQRNWIKYRDKTAKTESLEYEGGTLEPLQYTMTLSRLTKERCYELVEKYMK